ncbi:hypothetical protein HDU96_006874 [Phlyctochytrium bullatum]|nr:hypothetical protein HDU96_006874 [Phlyctochytrium bullatum]
MLEAEAAFMTDLDQLLQLIEDCIKSVTTDILNESEEDIASVNSREAVTQLEKTFSDGFTRVSYTDAIKILASSDKIWDYPPVWGAPLQSEHERFLAEQVFKKPTFITHYPRQFKPFYMLDSAENPTEGNVVECTDLIIPGIGELVGGSLREHREAVLLRKIEDAGLDVESYRWYLDLRSFGGTPHGGFGLGFERYMMMVTGLANIRDVIPIPRVYGSCRL